MAKYRKKPVVVEAYQTDKKMFIETLEGIMTAEVGDYIITGVNGEQYPCKPDIFEKTYEKVTEKSLNINKIDKIDTQTKNEIPERKIDKIDTQTKTDLDFIRELVRLYCLYE